MHLKKSNSAELASRGFLPPDFDLPGNLTIGQKLLLLKSDIATERTTGARLLFGTVEPVVDELIEALKTEKKLYPKIEICHTLISLGEKSINPLIAELGKIGSNQHQSIPFKVFEKDNYPLPRDIVARTLAAIGNQALPALLNILKSDNIKQLSEAIDAVGYICFYQSHPQVYTVLKDCFAKNIHNELICWKVIRAMSGFKESIPFLLDQKNNYRNDQIILEIDRSLRLLEKKK